MHRFFVYAHKTLSHSQTMLALVVEDLEKKPVPKQLAVGVGAGWMTGYLTIKQGKMVATAIRGTLLLLQIAHHKGYIKVKWNKMAKDSNTMADKLKKYLHLKGTIAPV
jgi:FUN14 domain-containing protein 1